MNNLHAAEKLVKVYSIVDPENPEWAYMQATLFSQLGMREFVIPSLGIAVALGFNDVTRLQSDPVFASFAQEPGFQQLIAKIQSN
jgi:2-methylisocitrate lyase-like PEP mutase family enzyme